MKILLASAIATTLGFGWFGSRAEAPATEDSACPIEECLDSEDCDVTVECLPDGTCFVECSGPNGETCWAVLGCDAEGNCVLLDCGGDCPEDLCSAEAGAKAAGNDSPADCGSRCAPISCGR